MCRVFNEGTNYRENGRRFDTERANKSKGYNDCLCNHLNSLVELDIGTIDKLTLMDLFLTFFIANKVMQLHKENYVAWILACKVARVKNSVDHLLLTELSAESNYWMKILQRILDDALFLSEHGLAFFDSRNDIGDPENGNFLGIIEFLSKYNPLLSEHMDNVRTNAYKFIIFQCEYKMNSLISAAPLFRQQLLMKLILLSTFQLLLMLIVPTKNKLLSLYDI